MTTLDRAPDGVTRKCDTCKRPFKGEAWMDYCAECNAENERTSPLHKRWACLTCNSTFELGKVRSGPQGWQCPNCKSTDLSTAEGTREIPEYHGDIPEQKQ
jgi:Zn finger protein HypA/HybF involved in hydrogenase expression